MDIFYSDEARFPADRMQVMERSNTLRILKQILKISIAFFTINNNFIE